MVDRILQYPERTRLHVLAPVVSGRKGEHTQVLNHLKQEGSVRIRMNGEMYEVTDDIQLDKNKKHSIEVVVDRIILRDDVATRLSGSIETSLPLGDGNVIVDVIGEEELLFSENHACPECGFSISEHEPRVFSFNSLFGDRET